MRRFAAHLALAAIWLGTLAPLVEASETSNLHACCLRNGMHHCESASSNETSGNSEFRSRASTCPYSAPLPLASFTGLNAETFGFASPLASRFDAVQIPLASFHFTARDLSARAPPVLL